MKFCPVLQWKDHVCGFTSSLSDGGGEGKGPTPVTVGYPSAGEGTTTGTGVSLHVTTVFVRKRYLLSLCEHTRTF